MSKSSVTYMKRELRKVMPVFALAVLYAAFIFLVVSLKLSDHNAQARLTIAFPGGVFFNAGNLFYFMVVSVLGKFHSIAVIVLEVLLIRKVFYLENRAGVSDFLRILPLKERDKLLFKVFAGELVILGFSVVFGVIGTVANAWIGPGVSEVNDFIPGMGSFDSYAMLWQISFMMFLTMSAIYLVLFVVQCCIHSVPLASFVGIGILLAPGYYTLINWIFFGKLNMTGVASCFLYPYPEYSYEGMPVYDVVQPVSVSWDQLTYKLLFLFVAILLALAVLVLVLRNRWNIRESNNLVINSPAVREFIITGFSISVGAGVSVLFNVFNINMETSRQVSFYIATLIIGAIVWTVIHLIGFVREKRLKRD